MGNYVVCFSPTGTTRKVSENIALGMRKPYEVIDLTTKKFRNKSLMFDKGDTVIIGAPVYAGRIPELVEKYYESIQGGGATAVPVVVYGNRHFDDALLQLNDLCKRVGFKTAAAGAFIGEHSYTSKVATARPDAEDLAIAFQFGHDITLEEKPLHIPGNRPYRPLQVSAPIAPSKSEACDACGECLSFCPVEAVDAHTFESDEHLCIKCHACVKKCPSQAKFFDERLDPVRKRLEDQCKNRREPEIFL